MIAFVTLFLGLVTGTQTIEISAAEPVRTVRILLDGELVHTLEGPPWSFELELGEELAPHHLVAVGLDSRGDELDRAEQWLNLPARATEAQIVIAEGTDGVGTEAHVLWESTLGSRPEEILAKLDGQPLEIQDPERIRLPDHDPAALHLLQIELRFPNSQNVTVDKVFGGTHADAVDTELTAVPVFLRKGARTPKLAATQGWFRGPDGRPLRVVGIEEGPADVVMVRDLAAQPILDRIRYRTFAEQDELKFRASLKRRQNLRFLYPVPRRQTGRRLSQDLFDVSYELRAREGGLVWFMTRDRGPRAKGLQRLADAVAVAGLAAAQRNRRRAVVLVIGPDPLDRSVLHPARVREFLTRLNVPLVVWAVGKDKSSAEWEADRRITNLYNWQTATRKLVRLLGDQRIVWLEGRHLPNRIRIEPEAPLVAAGLDPG